VARVKDERVWVSCPPEIPRLGCLGGSASWEAGPQGLRLGWFPETLVAVAGSYL